MKRNITALLKLFVLVNLLILALLSMPEHASAKESPVIWQHPLPGDFASMVVQIKTGLDCA